MGRRQPDLPRAKLVRDPVQCRRAEPCCAGRPFQPNISRSPATGRCFQAIESVWVDQSAAAGPTAAGLVALSWSCWSGITLRQCSPAPRLFYFKARRGLGWQLAGRPNGACGGRARLLPGPPLRAQTGDIAAAVGRSEIVVAQRAEALEKHGCVLPGLGNLQQGNI